MKAVRTRTRPGQPPGSLPLLQAAGEMSSRLCDILKAWQPHSALPGTAGLRKGGGVAWRGSFSLHPQPHPEAPGAGWRVLGKHCRTSPHKVRGGRPEWTEFPTQVSSAAEVEDITCQKLVKGHAYSVTGVEEVTLAGGARG